LLLICSFGELYAQKIPTKKPEKFAKTITAEDLSKHLYILASAEMEGRETAMPGERKAAAYIENEFRRFGLSPANNGSYHLKYYLFQDSLTDAGIKVNGSSFSLDKDFSAFIDANVEGTFRFSEIVFIGSKAFDSLSRINLAGKLVLVNMAPGRRITTSLINKGVAGILYLAPNSFPRKEAADRKSRIFSNVYKSSLSPQQYLVSEAVAKAILKENYPADTAANKVKTYPARIELSMKKTNLELETSNVMGMVEGTDLKDQYLFITAHHDHIGKRGTVINYGADDDGSGTVGVLEMAEAFAKAKKDGKGPRRTIVFMTVSGEEKGLLGSEYYSENPVFPMDKTTADLNIDMIGRIDPKRKNGDSLNYVYVIGDDKLSSDLRPISESVNKKYIKMELDYKFNDLSDPNRFYYRSDHYNFAKKGVPIIFYFNGTHADYHRPTDTPDKINYSLMAKRAQLVFYTAWEMANRNDMLKRDIPLNEAMVDR
jgi:Zn-dependent M28 family amino/carboxypeptidase